jgi:transcription elongation factor Elf1
MQLILKDNDDDQQLFVTNGSVDGFCTENTMNSEVTGVEEEYFAARKSISIEEMIKLENHCEKSPNPAYAIVETDVCKAVNVEDVNMIENVPANDERMGTEFESDKDKIPLDMAGDEKKSFYVAEGPNKFGEEIRNSHSRIAGLGNGSTRFQCHCGKSFARKTTLITHKKTHDANFETLLRCSECGRKFSTKAILIWHVKSTHQGYFYECPICGNRQQFLSNSITHIKKLHPGSDAKPLEKCKK